MMHALMHNPLKVLMAAILLYLVLSVLLAMFTVRI